METEIRGLSVSSIHVTESIFITCTPICQETISESNEGMMKYVHNFLERCYTPPPKYQINKSN